MTEEDAVQYVQLHADTATTPVVSEDEVVMILAECVLADSSGRAPVDEAWEPTYWLPLAVAKTWELKVARASTWVDMSTDGTSMSNSQAVVALNKMANRWRRRCIGRA